MYHVSNWRKDKLPEHGNGEEYMSRTSVTCTLLAVLGGAQLINLEIISAMTLEHSASSYQVREVIKHVRVYVH